MLFLARGFSFLNALRQNILCNLDSAKKLSTILENIYTLVPGQGLHIFPCIFLYAY